MPQRYDSPEQAYQEQIVRAQAALKTATGYESNLFRPPQGELTQAQFRYLAEQGYFTIKWSVDTRDYQQRLPKNIVKTTLRDIRP
jgi:peptidoglycan-N-acetylglucosamine deacetylase